MRVAAHLGRVESGKPTRQRPIEEKRRCAVCLSFLARDNTAELCSPCSAREVRRELDRIQPVTLGELEARKHAAKRAERW